MNIRVFPDPAVSFRIVTLGGFDLISEERPLPSSRKIQKKPLEILKVLVALGGREARRERLMDILWPEAEGDCAVRSFDTTMHRLRRLLGTDGGLRLNNGSLTIDERRLWVDALYFEEVMDCSGILSESGALEENQVPEIELALECYGGDFLPDEYHYPEIIICRERLRHKYFLAVLRIGRYWEQREVWSRAADWYRKALDIEELAEELYMKLMTCHIRLNRRTEALSVYRRCHNVLTQCIGNSPSPEIISLYKSLL